MAVVMVKAQQQQVTIYRLQHLGKHSNPVLHHTDDWLVNSSN